MGLKTLKKNSKDMPWAEYAGPKARLLVRSNHKLCAIPNIDTPDGIPLPVGTWWLVRRINDIKSWFYFGGGTVTTTFAVD